MGILFRAFAFGVLLPCCVAYSQTTTREISESWETRQMSIQSFELVFSEETLILPGYVSGMERTIQTKTSGNEVLIDGEKIKLGTHWYSGNSKSQSFENVFAFNGRVSAGYFSPSEDSIGQGALFGEAKFPELGNWNTWPSLLIARPSLLEFRIVDFAEPIVTKLGGDMAGEALVLNGKPNTSSSRFKLWITREAPFNVLRVSRFYTDNLSQVRENLAINYERGDDRSFPSSWLFSLFSESGSKLYSATVSVTSAARNKKIPASKFEISFPPGTAVVDKATGEEWMVGKNGNRLPYGPESPSFASLPTNRRWVAFVLFTSIIFIAIAIYLTRSRWV